MKISVQLCIAALLSVASLTAAASTVQLSIEPATANIPVTDAEFSVQVFGTFSPDASEELMGGGVDLLFDSTIVEVTNVTIDAPTDISASSTMVTGNGSGMLKIDNDNGIVETIGFATFAGVSGKFQIATVDFKILDVGEAVLTVQDADDMIFVWGDELGGMVSTVASGQATVTVVATPLPAAAWMLMGGLAVVFSLGRSRKKHA